MEWILFFQSPYGDKVRFIHDGIDRAATLSYRPPDYKFLKFLIQNFPIILKRNVLIDKLDSFKTIILRKNGEWEIRQIDIKDSREYTFEELYLLKEKREELENENKSSNFLSDLKNNVNQLSKISYNLINNSTKNEKYRKNK